ncbi:MAG: hypothetical protein GY714_02960 [Desulfobacterales bacterium]|nr:hypothetical protein [Desulfobacterales bacterium]MCP4159714.1 hypothetical protein [Deltaproteobacteria bacterium]
MNISKENLKYIADQAALRKKIVCERCGVKKSYTRDELIAKTEVEVELFDSIDGLLPEELNELFFVLKSGGFKLEKPKSITMLVDMLYLEIDIDQFIYKGLNK